MNRPLPIAALVLAVAALGCESPERAGRPSLPAAAPPFRLQFREGESRRYRSTSESHAKSEDPRMARAEVRSVEEVIVIHRVVAVAPSGEAVVDVSFESSAFRAEVPALDYSFDVDTRDPASIEAWRKRAAKDPRAAAMHPLLDRVGNLVIRMLIRPDGTVANAREVRSGRPESGEGSIGVLYQMQVAGWVLPITSGDGTATGGGGSERFALVLEDDSATYAMEGTRVLRGDVPGPGLATVLAEASVEIHPKAGASGETWRSGLGPSGSTLDGGTLRSEGILDVRDGYWRSVRSRFESRSRFTKVAAAGFLVTTELTFEALDGGGGGETR